MIRLALIAWLALCGVANAQLSGGVGGFPGPGTVHSAGGVSCSSSEGNAFLARLTGSPDNTHLTAYCTLIDGLVTDGVWTKLDALYMFAADTSANGLLNLVSGSTNATNSSTTFTADAGFQGSGTNQYVNTTVNPATTTQFTQNSGHFSVWGKNSAPSNSGCCSGYINSGPTDGTHITVGNGSGGSSVVINNTWNTSLNGSAATPGNRHIIANRSASNARQVYENGSSANSDTQASTAIPTGLSFWIGCRNFNGGSNQCNDQQWMMASVGASLNGTEAGNFYARVHTYLQTIAGIP
jgi:hypothetical protein